jgi:hypothetical protein
MTDPSTPQLSQQKSLQLEFFWWIFTGIMAFLVVVPILLNVKGYPFLWSNIIYVITFITLTRYIFLLKYTWLAYRETFKIIFFFLCIPLLFFAIQEINLFQTYLDENGIEALVGRQFPYDRRAALGKYVHSEMLLFGVGTVITGVIFPIRLLISIWRGRNTNKI